MTELAARFTAIFSAFGTDNPHSLDYVDELCAPGIVFEDPLQRLEGRDAFRRMNEHLLSRSALLRFEDVAFVGDDARLMATWTMIFRPKIGREMRFEGASALRLEGGRVVHHRDYWDLLSGVMTGFPTVEPLYKRVTALLG